MTGLNLIHAHTTHNSGGSREDAHVWICTLKKTKNMLARPEGLCQKKTKKSAH